MSRRPKRWLLIAGSVIILFTLLWMALPKPPLLDGISFSKAVFDRQQRLLRLTLSADGKYRLYTPLSGISPDLLKATLLQEDRFYAWHRGINPVAVFRAATSLLLQGHARGGASTVTMQVARLRFHLHTRTLAGKLRQMLLALEIERHYSKDEILEAYFNLAPYGGNIEGVGAASRIIFGKQSSDITLPEAVALSVIPQSPAKRTLRKNRENEFLTTAQNRLFEKLGAPPEDKAYRAKIESDLPFEAPQFLRQVLAENPSSPEITTTLDLNLQHLLEKRVAGYIAANTHEGIRNAATMLLDSRSMEVLAEVGSANFSDESIRGQVDGTLCRRSPGSTLKPFVYALALEQGLIHPLSILKDAPQSFGNYNPENYDTEFVGPINATEALVRSRNIPAVALASQLSNPTLYGFLKKAGVLLPHEEEYYGLTLTLGGAEVTMQELVRLYAMLSNEGRLRPLYRSIPHPQESGVRLLSPEASFLTLKMLQANPSFGEVGGGVPVSWKTGTSNGFHDAWAIAVFDHFVLAVWIGNFDGSGNPAFIGRSCAGPLLFQIINAMQGAGMVKPGDLQPPLHANLKRVDFCAISGCLATENCKSRVSGWFIPGISPITKCDVHREILVDQATGLRVISDDGKHTLRKEVYEFWPSDLMELFAKAGLPRQLPPPFLPGNSVEQAARGGKPPVILSPRAHAVYAIAQANDSMRYLPLKARTDADVRRLTWFVDRELVGESSSTESQSWKMIPGRHTVLVVDDSGRSDSCDITVEVSVAP